MPAVCGQARILSAGSHHSRQPACFQNSNVIRRGPRRHPLLVLASQKETKSKRARQPSAPPQQLQPSSSEQGTAEEAQLFESWVADPVTAVSAIAALLVVTIGIFGEGHALQGAMDVPVHTWVCGHTDKVLRKVVAGKLLSDSFIYIGGIAWAAAGVTLIAQSGRKGALLLLTLGFAYVFAGGFLVGGDVLLVDLIKHLFLRPRPTPSDTWSFPSGHTTAGTFIWGALLYVLLPLCLQPRSVDGVGSKALPSTQMLRKKTSAQLLRQLPVSRTLLWGAAIVTTASGRVLADRHWVSDTMAGACLGVALTSALALACNGIRRSDL